MNKAWRCLGSAVLLGLICWRVDWAQVGEAFQRASWSAWTLALALYLLTQVASSLRWQLLAGALGFTGGLMAYFRDYFLGMFFNLVLPTSVGGDVVRAMALANREDSAPPAGRRLSAALSVLADRVNGVLVLVTVACVATLACPVQLPSWMPWCVALLGVGGMMGICSVPLLKRLLSHARFAGLRFERPRRLLDAAAVFFTRPGLLLSVSALSLTVQAANVVVVWIIGRDLNLPVPAMYYGILVPLVSLLTLLPISLNGMGLREAGTVLLLAPLGVGTGEALTLSLLTFAVYTAAGACGGAAWLFGGRQRPAHEVTEPEPHQALAA